MEGAIAVVINSISAVGIIVVNKWLFDVEGWRWGAILVLAHTVATKIATRVYLICSPSTSDVAFPSWPIALVAGANVLSMISSTMSLKINSYGAFQLSRILVVPATAFWAFVLQGTSPTIGGWLSLVVVLVGVYLAAPVFDLAFRGVVGPWAAFAMINTSALTSIAISHSQKALNLTPFEAMDAQLGYVIVALCVIAPVQDAAALRFPLPPLGAIGLVALGSCLAVALNLSAFFVIGKLSPLMYQVTSHLKT